MFCAAPLYFAAYAANRRLGWRTDKMTLMIAGMLVGILLFVAFLLTFGRNGIYAAIAAALAWMFGFWNAARRNDVRRRNYNSRPVSGQQPRRHTPQEKSVYREKSSP